jgi:TonB family protein
VNAFSHARRSFHAKWGLPVFLVIVYSISVWAQTAGSVPLPQLVAFVAPPYPRAAADTGRMTGTTVTRIKVGKDGAVIEADIVRSHPLFAKYVLDALKQWKFTPSEQEYVFEVICRFELYSPDKCFTTPETLVSARLPTEVLIRTTEKCITTTTSDPVENRR